MSQFKYSKGEGIVAGSILMSIVASGALLLACGPQKDYIQAHNRALVQYANTDHDGTITEDEEAAFDARFRKDNGLILMPSGDVTNSRGKAVSKKTLTTLLENYTPSK